MTMTIADMLQEIKSGSEGTEYLDVARLQELYERAIEVLGEDSPLVDAIRTEHLLLFQFPEYARFRILVNDARWLIKDRSSLDYMRRVEFFNVAGRRETFSKFILSETRDNFRWIVMVVVFYSVLIHFLGNSDGLLSMFSVATQVVSIFTSVYIIFTATLDRFDQQDLRMFSQGNLADHHRTDVYLTIIAIVAIFTSLLGTLVVKTSKAWPVDLSINGLGVRFDAIPLFIDAVGLLQLIELAILFLSLPQYYLKRRREFLFGDLAHKLLDNRYADEHRIDGQIVALPQQELPPHES